jgi:hypothetical protein
MHTQKRNAHLENSDTKTPGRPFLAGLAYPPKEGLFFSRPAFLIWAAPLVSLFSGPAVFLSASSGRQISFVNFWAWLSTLGRQISFLIFWVCIMEPLHKHRARQARYFLGQPFGARPQTPSSPGALNSGCAFPSWRGSGVQRRGLLFWVSISLPAIARPSNKRPSFLGVRLLSGCTL